MGNDITIKNGGITYHFSETVRAESQKTIQDAYSEIREKSCKNKDFFDDLNVHICGLWDETGESDLDYETMGYVMFPILEESKKINLRTNRSLKYNDLGALLHPALSPEVLKANALHELGHLFDFNFASPNPELVEKLKNILNSAESENDLARNREASILASEYFKQNGLSDSEEFETAWRKDLQKAFKGKPKKENEELLKKLDYYSPKYFDEGFLRITLEDGIDEDEMILGDDARQEIFAQLFSYAMGSCDDEAKKHLLVNTYANTYEVVKNLINNYLGTNLEGHYVPRAHRRLDCNI